MIDGQWIMLAVCCPTDSSWSVWRWSAPH